ncbi:MAG: sulfatase-like hydrolase/transferase, partial [Planctomycetota bacterium]
MSRSTATAVIALVLVVLAGLGSCERGDDGGRDDARPNVLLVTFDTTRADHLGAYGATYAFTPTLDALAKESVKFNQAFAPAPLTLPGHTTIMTGLYPFYHGVRDNSHFVVDPGLNTLAEALGEAGYQTAATVAAFVLDSRFGLDQGFDSYDDQVRPQSEFTPFAIPERNASAVTDAAIDWLDSAADDRPFFLWVHYFDPHSGYNAPDSFTKYQGRPYDVEIAYTDSELGRLLAHVSGATGGKRQTLTVFTADHGEALGQYGEPTHGYFVYDSTLRVPLLIEMPDGSHAGEQIDCPVTLADLMPTILDVLELPVPGAGEIHGRSLLPLIRAAGQPPAELVERALAFECYEAHYSHGWARLQGVRIGETKFIDAPHPELYVFSENPKETLTANRYSQMPELAAKLEAAYRETFATELSFPAFTAKPRTPDQEVIEQLRALGYVGGSVPEGLDEAAGRDLKEMLPFYQRMLNAMAMISSGELVGAAELLVALSKEEPDNRRVLWMLAELAASIPAVADGALPTLEAAIDPDHGRAPADMMPQLLVNCGRIYVEKNQNRRALECFSDARQIDRDYAAVYWWLGLTYFRLGQGAEAIEAMNRAVELFGPGAGHTHAALGLFCFTEGETQPGVQAWSKLLDQDRTSVAIWRLAGACPLDPVVGEKVAVALQRCAGDRSLPPGVRAVAGIVCSKYLSLLQRNKQALAAMQGVQPLLPEDDAELQLALAGLHLRLGQAARARDCVQRAYEIAPDRVDVVGALAAALEQALEIDEAVRLLDDYYRAHPDDFIAANNLAWVLARQGRDLDRALKLARRAAGRSPGSATVSDTLGWVYHLRGDKEMAIHFLERAAGIVPRDATYQYHLAVAYREAGRTKKALRAFSRAVELAPTPRPDWYEE